MRTLSSLFLCAALLSACSSTSVRPHVLQTRSPVSVTVARGGCPIPLPDSAKNIQYAAWSRWVAHETYVRFEAPASDCLAHAKAVLQPYADELSDSVVSEDVSGPPGGFHVSDELAIRWFDISRFTKGVVFRLSKPHGPVVWVDTNRECFYFIDED